MPPKRPPTKRLDGNRTQQVTKKLGSVPASTDISCVSYQTIEADESRTGGKTFDYKAQAQRGMPPANAVKPKASKIQRCSSISNIVPLQS